MWPTYVINNNVNKYWSYVTTPITRSSKDPLYNFNTIPSAFELPIQRIDKTYYICMQCVRLLHFIRKNDVIRSMLAMHVGAIAEGTISDAFWKVRGSYDNICERKRAATCIVPERYRTTNYSPSVHPIVITSRVFNQCVGTHHEPKTIHKFSLGGAWGLWLTVMFRLWEINAKYWKTA